MANEDGKIIVKCPVCKIPVAPHNVAEIMDWYPRHVGVSPQCATGDFRGMAEEFAHKVEKQNEVKSK